MSQIVRPRPAAKDYYAIERIEQKLIDENGKVIYLVKWIGYAGSFTFVRLAFQISTVQLTNSSHVSFSTLRPSRISPESENSWVSSPSRELSN